MGQLGCTAVGCGGTKGGAHGGDAMWGGPMGTGCEEMRGGTRGGAWGGCNVGRPHGDTL